jgi:eukaryotic-like serine/threonine-protein kinase
MQLPARLGKYELQQSLGGGMSQVYKAFDTIIGRTVAVKILTDQGAQDPEARDRFLDEARTAAKVTHENVISIYDFGADPEKGLFMVMEFLHGEDLRSAIKGGRTGDFRNQLKIALQAARALDFIHANRIIHRDVKPENLHINSAGVVKLMDFGIAKSEDLSRTQPGFALGTPYYMSPEAVRGEKLTSQADVYAYGVLLFELFTTRKPFTSDTVEGIFYHILNVPLNPEPLETAGIPQRMRDLVVRCTAKNPADRPQGMAPVIAEIESILGASTPTPAPRPAPPPAAPPAPALAKRTNPMLFAGIGLAVLVAAGGAYFALKPSAVVPQVQSLPPTVSTPTGTMVLVPAGNFLAGQQKQPSTLPAFYIDQTEVTNAAYQSFCQATGRALPEGFENGKPDFPVTGVTFADARDFAQWAGKRLPKELEWEKAARGTDGRTFPWGNEADVSKANVGTSQLQPANSYRAGASIFGGLQFVGNVWEFVDQKRDPPKDIRRFASLQPAPRPEESWYMIRGLSAAEPLAQEVMWDSYGVPERWKDGMIGFRCAKNP